MDYTRKIQNLLGGYTKSGEMLRMMQNNASYILFGTVITVKYESQLIEIQTNGGKYWCRQIKSKASVNAGEIDYPNFGDIAVVACMGGKSGSPIILGYMDRPTPENTIVMDENKAPTYLDNKSRYYWKHETGSFKLLDKLGNFLMSFFRKATQETDPAIPNLDIELDNSGNLNITLYEADGTTPAMSFTSDQSGNVVITSATSLKLGDSSAIQRLIDERLCAVFNGHTHLAMGAPCSPPVTGSAMPDFIGDTDIPNVQTAVMTLKTKGD
jgi:hypothetical protein